MGENPSTNIAGLAEEYLDSLDDGEGAEGNAVEAREEFEYWEGQVDEFEEGTVMHEMAVEERDDWREKRDAINARGERREELRTELLTKASTEFAPCGEWVETTVIKALSHAFYGQQHERLFVEEFCLPDDQDEMSKRDMVTAAKTVHTLTRDALGDQDDVAEIWDTLDTDTRLSIAQALARHQEPLSSGQISDELGEDGPNDPGANIRDLRGKLDIEPFYGSGRGYTLTLAGRHVLEKYGPDLADSEEETDVQAESNASDTESSSELEEELSDDTSSKQEEKRKEVDLSSFDVRE